MIQFESSWGLITTDDEGNVLSKDLLENDGKVSCYLLNVKKFDVKRYCEWYEDRFKEPPPKPAHFDVLEVGFWNEDGSYVPPNLQWMDEMYFNFKNK